MTTRLSEPELGEIEELVASWTRSLRSATGAPDDRGINLALFQVS
jgi:hypothetical protein